MDEQQWQDDRHLQPLGLLAPGHNEQADAQAALARFHAQRRAPRDRRTTMMRTSRPLYAAALGVLALVLLVALPQTRALASEFLGIFRVQKFAPISVSPQQLALLDEMELDGVYPGEFTLLSEPTEPLTFASVDAAQLYLSQQEPWMYARTLPQRSAPDRVTISDGGVGQLTVNLAGARQIVSAVGIDPQALPDSLDGATITARVWPQLVQEWDDGLVYVQMNSPQIDYPTDVDPTVIGEALLRFLGMNERESARLAGSLDWTNTLLLPIPAEFATFQEVPINETTGIAITPLDGTGSTLLWQEYGTVSLLVSESASVDDLLALVDFNR